jgi:zinc protease
MKQLKNPFIYFSILSTLVLSFIAGCSSSQTKNGSSNSSNSSQQAAVSISKKGDFNLRPYQEETLPNGLKVIYIEDTSLPRVSFQMLVKVGSLQDPNKLSGLNYFTANLLDRGTKHRNMMALSNELAQIGSEISIDGDNDYTMISTDGLSIHSKELIELYADVILNPAFENQEIERIRSQILASIQKKIDHPDSVAADGLSKLLYGNHPYGFPTEGLAESIRKMSKKDFIKHYLKYFRPNNSILAVVGPQIEELKKEVINQFKDWPQRILENSMSIKVNQDLQAPKLSLISKESLKQTQVRFGMLGIQRNEKDFLPLRVANMILGGTFASRLNMRVRLILF